MGRILVESEIDKKRNDWLAFKLRAAKDQEKKRHGRTRGKVLRCLQHSKGSREFLDRTCGKLSDYPVGDHGGRWRPPPYLSGSYGDLGGTFVGGSKFNRSSSLPNRNAARKARAYYKPAFSGVISRPINRNWWDKFRQKQGDVAISADRGDAMGAKGDRGGIGGVALPFIPPRYREMRMKGDRGDSGWRGDRGGFWKKWDADVNDPSEGMNCGRSGKTSCAWMRKNHIF